MNIKQNKVLVYPQIKYILLGSMVGIGIFNLADGLAKDSYEAAWIPAILGAIYPLYLGMLAIFISNTHSDENILALSKKYFGKVIGTLLNLIFLIHFIIYTSLIISGFNNICIVYATPFLTPIKLSSIFALLAGITAYRGLAVIAKINKLTFYIFLFILLILLISIGQGSYLNLLPITDVSIVNILKSVKSSFLSYGGLEIIFLIIYYLGADIIGKSNWSLISLMESIKLEAINNFRFIFVFLWINIALRVISNFYFSSILIAKELLTNFSRRSISIVLYFIITYLAIKLSEVTIREYFIKTIFEKFVVFVAVYPSIIALFVLIKKDGKSKCKEI